MPERHIPVLIVGGSLVGLTTSALLAQRGVTHLLVETHAGTAIHPRAASFHQRTMEVFRAAGLQRRWRKRPGASSSRAERSSPSRAWAARSWRTSTALTTKGLKA